MTCSGPLEYHSIGVCRKRRVTGTERAPLRAGGSAGLEDLLGASVSRRRRRNAGLKMRFSLGSARLVESSGDRGSCLLCHFYCREDVDVRPCAGGRGLISGSAWMTATFSIRSKTMSLDDFLGDRGLLHLIRPTASERPSISLLHGLRTCRHVPYQYPKSFAYRTFP